MYPLSRTFHFSHFKMQGFCSKCTLEKCFYNAGTAHSDYKETLSESRQGLTLTEDEVSRLDRLFSPQIRNGQSIHHICVSNKDAMTVSESTIYLPAGNSAFQAHNIDLPRRIRFAARKRSKEAKVDME